MKDEVMLYREMCDAEGVQTLQRGMNYQRGIGELVGNWGQTSIIMSSFRGGSQTDFLRIEGLTGCDALMNNRGKLSGHDAIGNAGCLAS